MIYIHGNCQSTVIKKMLCEDVDFNFDVRSREVHSIDLASEMDAYENDIRSADIILCQPVRDNYRDDHRLSTKWIASNKKHSARLLIHLGLFFQGYFPAHGYIKGYDSYLMPYHDFNLLDMYSSGIGENESIYSLTRSDFMFCESFLEEEYTASLRELVRREKSLEADVIMSDIIHKEFRNHLLFHTINHPTRHTMKLYIERILEILGVSVSLAEDGIDYLPEVKCFPYGAVAKTLRLDATIATDKIVLYGEELPIQEYVPKLFAYYAGIFTREQASNALQATPVARDYLSRYRRSQGKTEAFAGSEPARTSKMVGMGDSVTPRDVEVAYALLLGRSPENDEVVKSHVENTKTLLGLRSKFIASREFLDNLNIDQNKAPPLHKPLVWPHVETDVNVSSELLAKMLKHIEGNWAVLGTKDPHWSVLTNEKFRAANIGDNSEAFYASGEVSFSYALSAMDRAQVDLRNLKTCFELGCGVGRVTVWLSRLFETVIAGDVSYPHLQLAEEAAAKYDCKNIDLQLLDNIDAIDRLPSFDFFYSVIVLQHNPPPVIAHLLRKVLKKLHPDGIGYFQVPTAKKSSPFKADEYLEQASISGKMEVHAIPQSVLFSILQECGCELLDIREDGWTGSANYISNSILVRKRS